MSAKWGRKSVILFYASVRYLLTLKRQKYGLYTDGESYQYCHRNFGPGNFGPGDQNFQWKIGPAGPIFSGKMVRLWKIGPNNGPSISALVTSDCCG